MEIERYDILLKGDVDQPTTMGLNIQRRFGLTHVNLFALNDNAGQKVSDNFWTIAQQIVRDIIPTETIEDINWSFTSGSRVSALKFSTLQGQPYRLDISDFNAVNWERSAVKDLAWSLEKYAASDSVPRQRSRSRELDDKPRTIFQIPCNHPDAKDGVFNCFPSYYDSSHMADTHEYVLVDTKKVIELLRKTDPDMLDHAARQFGRSTAKDWMESTSIEYPRDMGAWSCHNDTLHFCSGQAAILQLIQDIDLPFFPMAVGKGDNIDIIRQKVGYGTDSNNHIKPVLPTHDY